MSISPKSAGSKQGSTGNKPAVPLPAIIGAVVILLLFIGWLSYRTFAPPPHESGPTAESKNDWISQLAKQTGGDINKLDAPTREKLQIYTGGKGAELLKSKLESSAH